jgi:hypothetical protein
MVLGLICSMHLLIGKVSTLKYIDLMPIQYLFDRMSKASYTLEMFQKTVEIKKLGPHLARVLESSTTFSSRALGPNQVIHSDFNSTHNKETSITKY